MDINNNYPSSNGFSRDNHNNNPHNGQHHEDPDEIDLKRLFYTLWGHKKKIIGSVVLAGVLAGIVAFTATPIYESDGSLLITQPQNSYSMAGGSDLGSLLSSSYGIGMGSSIGNELQILRSRTLSLEIADSLMDRSLMNNGRQYPVLFKAYPDDSSMAVRDTVAHRLRENLNFNQVDREAELVNLSYESPSPQASADVINLAMELYENMSTRHNRRSANSAEEFLATERGNIEQNLNDAEQRLREFMNTKQLVEVDSQTEELIQRIAEMESRRQESRVMLVAVNSAIEQHEERLNKIKPGLSEQYADAIGPNMMRLQYQLAELETEKVQLLAKNPSLKSNPDASGELRKLNEEIEVYKDQIRERTQKLISEGDQYLGFLGDSDGNVSEAITELNTKLIELRVEQKQAEAQMEVIDEELAEQRTFFDELPDNMIELARLQRDVKINEELFLMISQQYAEMSLWKQTQFGLGRVVDEGYVPELPVKPNKRLFVLVGLILGGILSVGYVFVREAFNTRIDGADKLKKRNEPMLSVIPDMTKVIKKQHDGNESVKIQGRDISTSLVTVLDTISPISESFRRLENNIIYSNPDRKLNTLMVTSSSKGEGKTTTITNLGVVLAEAGYSVVLVDTDLRRPNLHNMFGLRRSPGMMEVLFEDISVDDAIQSTPVHGLSMLTAGTRPPNPASITQSEAFLNIISGLEEKFDFVLVDTPPMGIITDAAPIVRQADGVIVAARFNKTREAQLDHTIENLQRVKAHILGTVLTAFDYAQSSDYNYSSYNYQEAYDGYTEYNSNS